MKALNALALLFMMSLLGAAPEQAWSQSSDAQQQPASLSLFVFIDQVPADNVEISLNGNLIGTTNSAGRITADVPIGEQVLSISTADSGSVERNILFTDDELIQILINFFTDGRTPFLDIESSNPNKTLASAGPSQLQQDADPGLLEGQVLNAEDNTPLAGVRVFVSGTPQEVTTGEDGQFRFELPPGEYALSVLASRFNTRTLEGIPVRSNDSTTQILELTPAGSELPEFVVIVPYVAGSLASVLEERREQSAVANLLGSEAISKSGDSNAASALKRVTGLTLVDGQFIYVRGLGERYSSTLLNGATVPSPDPTRRVVPLDLFPAGIIDSIAVQKGYTHDKPGEFGGGTVEIRTNTIPDRNFLTLEISTGLNGQTTFKDGLDYRGGGLDFLGFDDGIRDIPTLLAEATANNTELRPANPFLPGGFTPEELEAIGESLPVIYDVNQRSIAPNTGFGLAGGYRLDITDDIKAGFLGSFEWGRDFTTIRDEVRRDFIINNTGELQLENEQFLDETQTDVNLSIFATAGFELYENHNIDFNWMWLRSSEDEVRITEGFVEDFNNFARFTRLRFEERELREFQTLGEHTLPFALGLKIDWLLALGTARQEVPHTREYRYDQRADDTFFFSQRNDSNSIRYSELQDENTFWKVDLSLPLELWDGGDIRLTGGIARDRQSRDSDIRRFVFDGDPDDVTVRDNPSLEAILNPEFIGPGQIRLIEVTRNTDNYTAERSIDAFHVGADFEIEEWLRLSGGVRMEQFSQTVTTFALFDPDLSPVIANLDNDNLLPSAAATIFLPWDQEVRLGFSETATRPDFKELSPAFFLDPVLDRETIGNPNLVDGTIKHYDLRWDKYFNSTDFVSISAFYKQFENPIEIIVLAGTVNIITFQNALSAENFGFEAEVYKYLDFLGDFWAPFYINANFAWIESEIQLAENVGGQTNQVRSLQGQSPYVINFQLGYDDPGIGLSAAILYNTSGERISEASTSGRPDIFEQPFHQLDFVISKSFGQWRAKFKFTNILDDRTEFEQGTGITRAFEKGREVSFGLQYTFE